ncbi:hypothetical protein Tco_0597829 [Tanacetum coccineum]
MASNEETNAAGTDTRPPLVESDNELEDSYTQNENKLEMADTRSINIHSQGLPRHIFNISIKQALQRKLLVLLGDAYASIQVGTINKEKEDLFDEYDAYVL